MASSKALTPQDVADRLQVAKNTVYELIKRGELRGYRVGNQVRVDEADLEAYRRPKEAPEARPAAPDPNALVLSGQDAVLDVLARRVEARGVRVLRSPVGSYAGLSGLYFGSVDAAACHLWDAATGRYNEASVAALVPGTPTVRVGLVTRSVGWYVPAGNPRAIAGWDALGDPSLRLALREKGSGIRVLLDARRALAGLAPAAGVEYPSHLAVASAVARGEVELGLGNEKTALQVAGVEFVPLQTEEVDLVVRIADLSRPAVATLLEELRSPAFRAELAGLGGYGLDRLGQARD